MFLDCSPTFGGMGYIYSDNLCFLGPLKASHFHVFHKSPLSLFAFNTAFYPTQHPIIINQANAPLYTDQERSEAFTQNTLLHTSYNEQEPMRRTERISSLELVTLSAVGTLRVTSRHPCSLTCAPEHLCNSSWFSSKAVGKKRCCRSAPTAGQRQAALQLLPDCGHRRPRRASPGDTEVQPQTEAPRPTCRAAPNWAPHSKSRSGDQP